MKKILVTGGSGFIGSYLIKKLIKYNFTVNIVGDFLHMDKVKNNGF